MPKTSNRIEQIARLEWIPLGKMRISPEVQGDLRPYRVDYLIANFDLEELRYLTVNERDGWFYVIDGQHRRAALIEWLGDGWETQTIQCRTYHGLTKLEEGDKWDRLNDAPAKRAFEKFRVRLNSGRPMETDIDRTIRSNGQTITQDRDHGIRAVGTLVKIYTRSDANTLGSTVRVIDGGYGNPGFEAVVLDGIGLSFHRYNGAIDEDRAISKLKAVRGGVKGLVGKAHIIREKTRQPLNQCLAAAFVDVYNTGTGGKKLPGWWNA